MKCRPNINQSKCTVYIDQMKKLNLILKRLMIKVVPTERHADPPLPLSKVAKLGLWFKNMRNVLKPVKEQFSNIYFLRYGRFRTRYS